MFKQHGYTALDSQNRQAEWACSMEIEHGRAAAETCSVGKQHGFRHGLWKRSKDMQHKYM
jgi:hypothetical protein